MKPQQKIFALIVCIAVVCVIIELVRRRRLKEEYSVLWLLTSVLLFILVLKYDWLVALTRLTGAVLPTTTLFIGAIIFLMLIAVQFSLKISKFTDQIKNLAQDNALLRHEIEQLRTQTDEVGAMANQMNIHDDQRVQQG